MMNRKKIVVAYDGSPCSETALKMAVELAKAILGEIILVSVIDVPTLVFADGIVNPEELEREVQRNFQEKEETGMKYCKEMGVKSYATFLRGNPPDEIIKYAHEEKAYMIVTGTRGLGGFKKLLLGSVAHKLVTYSDIPVLVAK